MLTVSSTITNACILAFILYFVLGTNISAQTPVSDPNQSVATQQPTSEAQQFRIKVQADNSLTMGYVLGGLALAVLGLIVTGIAAFKRSRKL